MKKNLVRLLIFLGIVLALDKVIGVVCQKLYVRSNEYTVRKLRYTLDSTRQEILVLGSSRAEHHFIPNIISQSTGMTTYNCGFAGEGFLFSLIQLNETLKRYTPRFVVIEASPSTLSLPNPEESLKLLLPYYKRDSLIYNALTGNGYFEHLKFASSIYPYNSTIASLISGNLKRGSDTLNGFKPLDGTIDTSGVAARMNATFVNPYPPEKFVTLKEIISTCRQRNIPVAVVNSPVYLTNTVHDQVSNQIKAICAQYPNAVYLDYSKLDSLYVQGQYFKDYSHLNSAGAAIFTRALSKDLAEQIRAKTYAKR
ncbi:SGNH/GDSL hydrolase family protein [Flavisolibacter nicotianae]|uniref:SGNH/GDSL hydrolase family protein n=1 Tax=Flavisolibacter nicotianae TaxID=2364882 RepID=UPI000EAC5F05|nr:SGNH/GDSL hydrolase family protein [Flavisolibacter nicotianae]